MTSRFEIVTRILRNLGLESYLESFKKNFVDDDVLEYLDEIDHLKDIIPVLGARIKFFNELKRVKNGSLMQQSTMSLSQFSICDEPDEPKSTYPPKEMTIIEMKEDSLSINLNNLSEIFDQIELTKTIILTIVGQRSPQKKSFILTNIYKYFEQVENSNGNSIDFEPSEPDENVQSNQSNCLTMHSKSIRLQNAAKEDIQVIVMDLKSNEFDDKNELTILEKLIFNISACVLYITENPEITTNSRLSKYLTAFPLYKYIWQKFITLGQSQSQENSGLKVNFFAQNCDAFFLPKILEESWNSLEPIFMAELHNFLKTLCDISNLKDFNLNGYQIKEIIEKCVSNHNLSYPRDDSVVFMESLRSLGIVGEDQEKSSNLNVANGSSINVTQMEESLQNVHISQENGGAEKNAPFSSITSKPLNSMTPRSEENQVQGKSMKISEDLNLNWTQIVTEFVQKFSNSVKNQIVGDLAENELDTKIVDIKNSIFNEFILKFEKQSRCLENFKILEHKLNLETVKIKFGSIEEKKQGKKRVEEAIELCISSFEQNLKSQLEKFLFVPPSYFDSEGFTNVQSIFAEFVRPYDEELFKICEPQISPKIQEIIARCKIENEESRQIYTEELQKILENSFKNYQEEMDQFTKKTMYEPEDLQTAQTSIKHRTLDEFSNHEIFRNLTPITCENYCHELDLTINNHFNNNRKFYLEKQVIIEERLKMTFEQSKTTYEEQMGEALNDNFLSDEDFKILHENCLKDVKVRFVEKMSDILLEIPPKYLEDLEKKMKKKSKKLKSENKDKKANALLKAENSVSCEARNYDEKMTQYCSKGHLKDRQLEDLHETEMEKCLENFRSGFPRGLPSQGFESDLMERVKKTYETISDLNFLRREDEEAFKNKVDKYVKMYSTEMENYFANKTFHKREDLSLLHRNLKAKLSKISTEEYSFEQEKLADLDRALDLKFKYFEDQYLMNQPKNPAVGIDLGTTYSCIGVFHNNRIKIIENKIGKETTPSYVQFSSGGRVTVGEPAKASSYLAPESTIYDSKRLIGKNFSDPIVQSYFKHWPFQVIKSVGGDTPLISVMEIHKEFRPEEISSHILKELKEMAIAFLELEENHVLDAVITVPYYFTDRQRLATKDAGELAGLKVLRIINEPTAASIAYRLEYAQDEMILVYDLGGGTFDVSLIKISNGNIEVEASGGDKNLGGQNFDNRMIDYCLTQFKEKTGVDIVQEMKSRNMDLKGQANSCMSRLRAECERKKCELSQIDQTWVNFPKAFQHHDMRVEITRDIFEKINEDLFQRTITIVEDMLSKIYFEKEDINEIVLVGGSTRIPKIQSLLQNCFDGRQLKFSHRPDHVVAEGAAILAALINGGGGERGAKLADFKVNDVTPHSLGIEMENDIFSEIIKKNTRVPHTYTRTYSTVLDNQATALISIYEGEKLIAKENNHLGLFIIENIPPAPKGREKINVKMEIDEEGILKVTATNRDNSTDITLKEYRNRMTMPEDK